LPELSVELFNQDPSFQEIVFTQGGNYRTGRLERWRVECVDAEGTKVKVRTEWDSMMGGGIFTYGVLGPTETWRTTLPVSNYLPALKPGTYTLRVLYHDRLTIAEREDVSHLLTVRSPEIHLTVRPLVVHLSPSDDDQVRSWVASINDQPMKIVAGTYGAWAFKFVPQDSARGRVLAMGFTAIPTLLAILEETRSSRVREEVLCLLYSITGEHDPRRAGQRILGAYKARTGPWQVSGQGQLMGFGWPGEESVSSGEMNEKTQIQFARQWQEWRKYIEVQKP
jgi:hypothetical protein